MNRFRTKKKGKDELDAPRPSIESESSSPFRMFGKKKAPEEEPKKELDLATALPSTDDFRTSLLMTNLSARFSMLREQDDPNTKLGKASDDSVLFPNRQSRMMDFGFAAGLGDIAEVESVKAPFARSSVLSNDDTSSLNGSVMGRSKPIEGNNLFGGRQKVYKIGAGGNKGAMSGRVLYGDDVAQSAFQKWRQSEKDRQSFDDLQQSESLESEIERPESPSQIDYNRKRETNSTTSSGPYAARDSTAATSVSSSQKDRESFANTFRTASPTPTAPTVERTVTRTRRLYEQSLNQDQQDHQTSALSRFDTLSKRTIGSRTPDLTPPVPSPSSATFGDRFITRSVLGKASAPNLRSFSPSSESVNKFPNMDQKAFGATPPLSPPISETGEVQPLDRNMILSRNNSQYDESRFAQRQVQMQRGRETPTTGFRNNSNTSLSGPRSRSPSAQRTAAEKSDSGSFPTVQEESQSSTFFDDDDDEDEIRSPDIITPQLTVEKPADIEHPALRHSAMPTPLIISDGPGDIASAKVNDLPHDSPTLGPTSGGLSGMVRQHLRSDSNASSIYGSMPNDADLSSRFPPERPDAHAFEPKTMDSNAWESIERDLAMSIDGSVTSPTRSSGLVEAQIMSSPEPVQEFRQDTRPQQQDETDEFARHLADGARRVRERLTSFVESDSGATVPQAPLSELPPPPRPNALGILKSKPSIGSMERGRGDREAVNQSKTKKLLGLRGSSPASAKVSPTRDTFDDRMPQSPEGMNDADTPRDSEEKEGVHAGLKAFRQARRDLQRMKELELQQRRQGPQSPPTGRDRAQTATSSRAPSQERSRPPPVSYNRMPSEEAGANGGSRAGSRAGSRSGSRAPSERDRSGSEASSGGRSGSRPPRVRAGSSAHDDYQGPLGSPVGVNAKHRQGPMIRSPMMPGQEMRRSPHPQSQQPYPGNASSGRFGRSENSLHIHPAHGYDLGQPSPISPCAPSPKGFASHGPGPQRPYGPGGMMRNRDMSEPSIKSSGSPMGYPRSGPAPLNGGTVSTPNLHGNVGAPPLPPINPRRKNTGVALGDATMNAHHLPSSPGIPIDQRGLRGEEDEGIGHYRQRLRKATSEANVNARARSMLQNPAPPMVPPPMPPSTSSNALPGGMI